MSGTRFVLCVVACLIFCASYSVADNAALIAKIEKAHSAALATISSIREEWQVDKLPYFLKSCFMHKLSWELMKLKYEKKILAALEPSRSSAVTFVISFTGSSVTAGHDSHFNASTPVQTGLIMKPAFDAIGIQLESRNVALGNNPCTPYDACVKFFCGDDADVVHWEQTYFCADNRPIIEQFIRQASFMKSQPVVVFSDSHSGKWDEGLCKTKPSSHKLAADEEALLKADPIHLVSELNRDELQHRWGWLAENTHHYHSAGIQTFQHLNHEKYACEGPYIADWNKGAASWHPSVIAHRMRAAHHAYFWLLIYSEALANLKAQLSHRVLDAVEKDVEHRLTKLHAPLPPRRLNSDFPDDAKCYTDYEPRSVREASLKGKVISGLASEGTPGWTHMIYEDIVDHNLVLRSITMDYKDFKYLIHGNKDSGVLNVALDLATDSPIIICETPGIWGSLPKGYDHLWSGILDVYVTYNVPADSRASFQFKKEAATKLELKFDKANEICLTAHPSGGTTTAPGSHVLSILGTSSTQAIIAWIITA